MKDVISFNGQHAYPKGLEAQNCASGDMEIAVIDLVNLLHAPDFRGHIVEGFGGQIEHVALDKAYTALQRCGMTALPVSKRGTITLPPEFREALGLASAEHPMMLAELCNGGVFLQPAEAITIRDTPLEQMQKWIAEDERDAEGFWQRAGQA